MTLCTAKLNMGSTLFLAPPLNVLPLVAEDSSDLRELDLCKAAPTSRVGSASSLESGNGLSDRSLVVADDSDWPACKEPSVGGRPMVGVAGVTGADREVISVPVEAVRTETPDTDLSRALVSLTTSWIWRLSGFFAEVGGGLTMM